MSDATPSVAIRPDYEHYLAQHAARARLESECRPANKAALFDTLAAAGITMVVVTFDGYGDSGQIESIDARTADAEATLPDATITLADPLWDGSGVEPVTVSVAEAMQITEVRMAIEGLCGRKAAEAVQAEEIEELRALGERMVAAVDGGDVVTYSGLNQQLHERIITMAHQPIAAELLSRLRARNVRHQFRLAYRAGRPQVSLPQHLAIIDAVCRRDPDAAEAAVRAHLSSVIEALRESHDAPST